MYCLNNLGDINLIRVAENAHVLERINILTSILAAVLAGILNANLYGGILSYLGLHFFIAAIMMIRLGDTKQYFLKPSDIVSGLGSGVLVFLCIWIIVYNVVYTL